MSAQLRSSFAIPSSSAMLVVVDVREEKGCEVEGAGRLS